MNDWIAQLSAAVGAVQVTTASQTPASLLCVMSLGQPLMTGFSVSLTVTVNEQGVAFVFPQASSAVYVTVVTPTGNVSPGLCDGVSVTPGQLSLAVGAVQVTTAEQLPVSLDWVMSLGQPMIVGSVQSSVIACRSTVGTTSGPVGFILLKRVWNGKPGSRKVTSSATSHSSEAALNVILASTTGSVLWYPLGGFGNGRPTA